MFKKNPLKKLIKDGGFTGIFQTLGCIGDSLSSGEHESLTVDGEIGYHDYYEYSWGQYIARRCGNKVYNFSQGGLTAKAFNDSYSVKNEVFVGGKACQGYIIALGVNDVTQISKGNMEFGDISDIDLNNYENNKDTFIGNYAKIIQKVKKLQPKARVFLLTMPKCFDIEKDKLPIKKKANEFIRSLANIFEFTYIIDLEKHAKEYNEKLTKLYFCGGHLSSLGYMYTADMVSTYIDYIVKNNYDDFKQVAFIGTPYYHSKEKW